MRMNQELSACLTTPTLSTYAGFCFVCLEGPPHGCAAWLIISVNKEITTIHDNLLFVSADVPPNTETSVFVTSSTQEHYFQHLSNEEVCDN